VSPGADDATADVTRIASPDGATAEIHRNGAHVTSWRAASDNRERLFLSARARTGEGASIRGGIPVIFPQFAAEGPLPKHGFARNMPWTLDEQPDAGVARFTLRDSVTTRAIWPASFFATLTVRIAGRILSTSLTIENTSAVDIHFTAALHTYLRTDDIGQVELAGLQGARYRVSGDPGSLRTDDDAVLRIAGELDRVYVGAPTRLVLREPGRELVIDATNFPDAVIWNPGAVKAAAMDDMEPGGERHMVCVEAAAIQSGVRLEPGARWTGRQTLMATDFQPIDAMSEIEESLAIPATIPDPRHDLALKLREMEDFVARAQASGEEYPPQALELVKHLRDIVRALDGLTTEMGG
jgi:Uncharacterized enzymes related to aldose 1-epimerase